MKQRLSLVNPTIVTKVQFIRTKSESIYIGRQRKTLCNKNDTRVNTNCKYNGSSMTENSNTKRVSLFGPPDTFRWAVY